MPDLILAHDIGTSGNKATLYSVDGPLVASATVSYDTHYFNGNWAEQDPEAWWTAVTEATRAVLEGGTDGSAIDPSRVGVVSFSGQMMACVCVGADGQVLRPAIIWADQRSVDQTADLLTRIGLETGYDLTGHRISPSYSLTKLLWLRDNEPRTYARIHKVLNPKDFIINRLTGSWVTDETDASGTLLFDLAARGWSPEMIQAARISPDILPEVHPSTTVVGTVTSAASRDTGIPPGTPVVCGAGDGICAAVGAGCVTRGSVYAALGTSAWIAMSSTTTAADPEMRTFTFAHAVPGLYSPCGTTQAAGSAFEWARGAIYDPLNAGATTAGTGHEDMNRLAAQAPVGSNGVVFLPYVIGERTPWWNPVARGAFVGLGIEHTRADLLRAVTEGIFLNMRIILNVLRPHITSETMDVIGGFARGRIQQRIMADVFGMPLAIAENLSEATSMGAAVIGGVGRGLLDGFGDVDRFRSVSHIVEPDAEAHARYDEILPVFVESYRVLEPVYKSLAELA